MALGQKYEQVNKVREKLKKYVLQSLKIIYRYHNYNHCKCFGKMLAANKFKAAAHCVKKMQLKKYITN